MAEGIECDLGPLWREIGRIGIGMVTTRDGDVLRSRPMVASADRDEAALYFFVNCHDHKIAEVAETPEVEVAFVDSKREIYVSVSGRASLVMNREKAREHWSAPAVAWFREGIDDPELRLLRVEVLQAEMWDVDTSMLRKIWEIGRSLGTAHNPDLTENTKFRAKR
jgi:general stress protein 26